MSFPGFGSMSPDIVYVEIGGSSAPLVDALSVAQDSLKMTADSMGMVGAAAEEMGASTSIGVEGMSRMSSAALEAGSSLDDLAAQSRMATQSMAQMGGVVGGAGAGGAAVGGGGFFGSFGGGAGLNDLFGEFGSVIGSAIDPMIGFIQQAGAMVAGLVSFSVLNDVIQEVEGFTDALMQLNIQTEKNQFSWRYLYGGGNTPQGAQIAQGIADWTKSFSMQIPYTRQDLLDAITNLAPMGLSAQGLEHYMPMIADLAATRDPNANLQQVAQVIMSASMGYTRMLKYDLKINPEDLIQYGLNATGTGIGLHINDPSTLLPALENYSKAKGLSGAAKDISQQTWWGAWSSFMDRIQNFELDSGSGLFKSLKNDLNDLSSWIDTHYDQINRFASLFSDTLSNAVKTAGGVIGDFMSGVGASGLFAGLFPTTPTLQHHASAAAGGSITDRRNVSSGRVDTGDSPLNPPQNLNLWQQAGQIIGGALKAIGQGWQAVSGFWSPMVQQEIKQLAQAFTDFKNSLSPDDVRILKEIGAVILSIPWMLLIGTIGQAITMFKMWTWVITNIVHPLEDLNNELDTFVAGAVNWGKDLITNIIQGIKDEMGNLGKAIDGVAGAIAGPLKHSKPAYGPLADDDMWGAHFVDNLIHGMQSGMTRLATASERLAGSMAGGFQLNGGYLPAGSAASGGGPVAIYITGSSTAEIQKIIDTTIATHGANVAQRKPNRGAYGFGTYGLAH